MAENLVIFGKTLSNVTGIKATNTTGNVITYVDTHDANAVASDILNGKTAYVNGAKITGTNSGSSGGGGGLSDHSIENAITTIYLSDCSHIYENAFGNCGKLQSLYLLGNRSSICTLMNANAFANTPMSNSTLAPFGWGSIYVPSSMYNAYVAASNWSQYSARIVGYGGSEVTPIDPENPNYGWNPDIERNGIYMASDVGLDGWTYVYVYVPPKVDVDDLMFSEKTITSNGTYTAANDNLDAYTKVVVDVPLTSNFGSKIITSSGTYNALTDGLDGYSTVTVSIPVELIGDPQEEAWLFDGNYPNGVYSNDRVSRIGIRAFYNDDKLVSANFPNCIEIDEEAFGYCDNLSYIVLSKCKSIGSKAFDNCMKLSGFYAPVLENIEAYAFNACGLTNINISNVPEENIGEYAFRACDFVNLNLSTISVINTGWFERCTKLETVSLPNCSRIGSRAFNSCTKLETVSLPNCRLIESNAFKSCANLKSVYLMYDGRVTFRLAEINNAFEGTPLMSNSGTIYVPSSRLSEYKSWYSIISNRFRGI